MEDQVEQMPSTVFPGGDYQRVESSQLLIPTIPILILLVIVFILLKKFIYTPDEKRDGM